MPKIVLAARGVKVDRFSLQGVVNAVTVSRTAGIRCIQQRKPCIAQRLDGVFC